MCPASWCPVYLFWEIQSSVRLYPELIFYCGSSLVEDLEGCNSMPVYGNAESACFLCFFESVCE